MQMTYRIGQSTRLLIMVALSILLLVTVALAVEPHGTTVKRDADGCTVHLILQFGVDGTDAEVNKVRNALQNYFNITCEIPCPPPSTKECDVKVKVDVQKWDTLAPGVRDKYHKITMQDGSPSWAWIGIPNSKDYRDANGNVVTPRPETAGSWRRTASDKVYTHEALHLAGLDDTYCSKKRTIKRDGTTDREWHELRCPKPPGPDPCEPCIYAPRADRCGRPCENHSEDIMATTSCRGKLTCDHILEILAKAGQDPDGADLDSCPPPCCDGKGACCKPDGSCEDDLTPEECQEAGGVHQGSGTTCDESECPSPCTPEDNGECDTLYKEVFPGDEYFDYPGPDFVRVPLYVTHDVPDSTIDSIAGFTIPLCFTQTNASKYCSLSAYWNNTDLYPYPTTDRSIFRHLDGETNWMMALSERMDGSEWDTRILTLDGTSHFWLSMFPTGQQDQRFEEGSRVLLATMTFKLEDTMTICIDSCLSPPNARLAFTRSDGVTYIPSHFFPQCEVITPLICGDCMPDGVINLGDLLWLIGYLYKGGPAPNPLCIGDVNCDSLVDLGDVLHVIGYLYKGGSAPCPECCSLKAGMEKP